MKETVAELLDHLSLERLEENLFRGTSRDIGSARVFGGQVLGQSLQAASATVEEGRTVHSLHAYFLRAGDADSPIIYDVDRARDGRSFSNRRVVAIQHGRPIFNFAASFQVAEEGCEHQIEMPDVPGPDELPAQSAVPPGVMARIPEKIRRWITDKSAFEFRPVMQLDPLHGACHPPIQHVWMKCLDQLPDDPLLHRCMLAYVSDFYLLWTAALPHGINVSKAKVQIASLDHAMWFHRPLRVDQWLLYSCDSPSSGNSRGLTRGGLYTEQGTLVASATQEGLIRLWE